MPDPASISLGACGLFSSLFKDGKSIYEAWNLTQSFPRDMRWARAKLEAQWLIFERKAEIRLCDLRVAIDPNDPTTENNQKLTRFLREVVGLFADCDSIIRRYGPPPPRKKLQKQNPNTEVPPVNVVSISQNSTGSMNDSPTIPEIRIQKSQGIFDKIKTRFSSNSSNDRKQVQSESRSATAVSTPNSNARSLTPERGLRVIQLSTATESEQREDNALEEVGFMRRGGWVLEGINNLESKYRELKEANALLNEFLELKNAKDLSPLFSHNSHQTFRDIDRYRSARLSLLHSALQELNAPGKPNGPYLLSIKIFEKESTAQELLDSILNRPPSKDSYAYFIQRHLNMSLADIPITLAIDTSLSPIFSTRNRAKTKEDDPVLDNLSLSTSTPVNTLQGLAYWGHFDGPSYGKTQHYAIYHDTEASWSSITTLAAMIQSEEYVRRVLLHQLLQIARIVSVAYLSFLDIRSVCKDPQLDDIRFYRESDGQSDLSTVSDAADWTGHEPLILKPWMFMGFGSQKQRRGGLGSTSAMEPSDYVTLVALGLVLYQLATGTVLDYSGGYESAKRQALANIRAVDKVLGANGTIIITSCLLFSEPFPRPAKAEVKIQIQQQISFVIGQIHARELAASLDPSLAFASSRFSPPTNDSSEEASQSAVTHYGSGLDPGDLELSALSLSSTLSTTTNEGTVISTPRSISIRGNDPIQKEISDSGIAQEEPRVLME